MAAVSRTCFGRRSFSGGNSATFIRSNSFYFSQEQRRPNPRHTNLTFLVSVLLDFLQLKYQGKNVSAFETHHKTMWVAIASLLLYCLAYDAELRIYSGHPTPAYARVVRRGLVLFGSLSSVSLASILFQDSIRPILFFFYMLFSAGELLNCRLLRNWLEQRTRGSTGQALISPSWSVPRVAQANLDGEGLLPV